MEERRKTVGRVVVAAAIESECAVAIRGIIVAVHIKIERGGAIGSVA